MTEYSMKRTNKSLENYINDFKTNQLGIDDTQPDVLINVASTIYADDHTCHFWQCMLNILFMVGRFKLEKSMLEAIVYMHILPWSSICIVTFSLYCSFPEVELVFSESSGGVNSVICTSVFRFVSIFLSCLTSASTKPVEVSAVPFLPTVRSGCLSLASV